MPTPKPEEKMPPEVRKWVDVLKEPDWGRRVRAAWTLGEIYPHESAVPHLIKALQDRDGDVRYAAAKSLGKLKHESALPHLAKTLQDNSRDVRTFSLDSIMKILHSIQGKGAESKEGETLLMVAKHFRENEDEQIVVKALQAAFEGKLTPKNTRLYFKQLRAMKGKLK